MKKISSILPRHRGRYVFSLKVKLIFILVILFQFSLHAKSQTFNFNINKVSLEEALELIKSQSEYDFFFAHEEISSAKEISLKLKDASIDEVLQNCLKNSGLDYKIIDNVIIIKPIPEIEKTAKESVTKPITSAIKVSGTVISAEDGLTMPGVTVLIKGTVKGVTTDIDGKFTIKVPDKNAILIFSSIGFEPQEVPVGENTTIDIVLKSSVTEINEVVVTAIGTKVKADETGTTSSVVGSATISKSGESGVINSLAGKASGVKIAKSNGDPGAGSAIQIRGSNTIAGSSQPLIIMDGIPISNDNIGDITISQQSRLDDINAKDIESVRILKGASAAALWGSRAANGVIVITTKMGKVNQKPKVQYSYTHSFDVVSVKEPLQNKYGQGRNGVWSSTRGESWGDKIADRSGEADEVNESGGYFISNTTGKKYYNITKKNSKETYRDSNWDQVFRTGQFAQHNISISGGGGKTSYFFSFENMDQDGIIKKYDYHRKNVRLNTKTQVYDWLSWNNKVSYTHVKSNRIIQAGETTNGVMLGLLRCAPDFDITDYVGTYVNASGNTYTNRQRYYRGQIGASAKPIYNNPLWTINKQKAPDEVNHFIINPELDIHATDWLKFIVRSGLDYYKDCRDEYYPIGSASSARCNGLWTKTDITNKEINFDGIAIATHDFNKDVKMTVTLGVNYNDRQRYVNENTLSPFSVDSESMTTDLNPDASATSWETTETHIRSNRGYGVLGLDLFDQLFITISGATEAASTISGTFFYPSVDLAWQFTDWIKWKGLSFGKLRFTWGKVGIQPDAYKFSTLATTGYDSFGGSFLIDEEKGNSNLKPEVKTEWEAGTDLRFLKDRISLGFTYYSNQTKDILFAVKTNPSSGYTYNYKNAAVIENKGMEIDLTGKIIENKSLQFSVSTNFNNNKNKVVDIAGAETVDIGGTSKAVKGYPMSSFYLPGSLRDESNNLELDANGFPQLDTEYRVLGDPNPDWRGGLGFELKYKNFDFSILFEHSQGGQYIDRTKTVLYGFGLHTDVANEITLTEDLKNINGDVFAAGTTIRGNIANFGAGNVLLDENYYRGIGGGLGYSKLNDFFVEDATWTKLRNVTLGYTFKKLKITNKFDISSIRISATGRDLILWTKLVGVDPETNNYGVSNSSGMNYFNNPGTRSWLFNVEFNF